MIRAPVLAALLLLVAPAAAHAATITLPFDFGDFVYDSGGQQAVNPYSTVEFTGTIDGVEGAQLAGANWSISGYSDLSGVVTGARAGQTPANTDITAIITLRATDPTEPLTLISFDMGKRFGSVGVPRAAVWYVYDLDGNFLAAGEAGPDATAAHVIANVTAVGGLSLRWADAWEFGVDNVTYSVVPVPAALPLLATGLVGLAWLRRRRRQA